MKPEMSPRQELSDWNISTRARHQEAVCLPATSPHSCRSPCLRGLRAEGPAHQTPSQPKRKPLCPPRLPRGALSQSSTAVKLGTCWMSTRLQKQNSNLVNKTRYHSLRTYCVPRNLVRPCGFDTIYTLKTPKLICLEAGALSTRLNCPRHRYLDAQENY